MTQEDVLWEDGEETEEVDFLGNKDQIYSWLRIYVERDAKQVVVVGSAYSGYKAFEDSTRRDLSFARARELAEWILANTEDPPPVGRITIDGEEVRYTGSIKPKGER